MYLERLILTNYRNYIRLDLELPPGVVLIYGDNAQGKTNLLEAVYVLATSRSPLTSSDRHLIHWRADEEPLPHARIEGMVRTAEGQRHVEIVLTKLPLQGTRGFRLQKHIKVDGVTRRALDLIGLVPVVLFAPQDIDLVTGPPSGRRRYLDATLCQMDSVYCRTLSQYNRIVTQRNHLLRAIQEGHSRPDELPFWDERLIEHGTLVITRRQAAVSALNALAHRIHRELTGGQEELALRYLCNLAPSEAEAGTPWEDAEAVAAAFQTQLKARQAEEIARGMTVVGPHRDDLGFTINGVDAGAFASRGQQRTIALSLKLAETALLTRETGEPPLLLLDDVMSELDAARRRYLMAQMRQHQQTLITTTDLEDFGDDLKPSLTLHVVAGQVTPVSPEA